jgi:two-component system invasion response regulator UvrY
MKFIIADDSEYFRRLFRTHLSQLGYDVLAEAKDGSELILQAKKLKPDMVLTDVGMSPVNGMDAAISILKDSPDTKIICITMHNISAWIYEMQVIGIKGYVYKHSDPDNLKEAIGYALQNKFYADKAILENLLLEIKALGRDHESNEWGDLQGEIDRVIHSTQKVKDVNGFVPNERQLFILSATANGKPIKQIAELLKTSDRNIGKIKVKMREACGVDTNSELLTIAYKNNWLRL